jgi:hypothetical protein
VHIRQRAGVADGSNGRFDWRWRRELEMQQALLIADFRTMNSRGEASDARQNAFLAVRQFRDSVRASLGISDD